MRIIAIVCILLFNISPSYSDEDSKMLDQEWKAVIAASDNGNYKQTIVHLNNLLKIETRPQDRAMIWVDIAICNEKLDNMQTAIEAYEEAINIENGFNGYFAQMNKALLLYKLDKFQESLEIHKNLLQNKELSEEDTKNIVNNINTIEKKLKK